MLARIAHELYWLGRSLARAEHTARMLDGVFHADVQGRPDDPAGVQLSWSALRAMMAAGGPAPREHSGRGEVLRELTLDADDPASVLSCVERAREGARTVSDVVSGEMWQALNTFRLDLRRRRVAETRAEGPYVLFQLVKERCGLVWGLADRTMLRDEGHAFLTAGGRLESADMVLRMLRVALPQPNRPEDPDRAAPVRDGQALALLHAVGGFQAFRRARTAPPNAVPVSGFLLFDRAYPRSVAASVDALGVSLRAASGAQQDSPPLLRLNRLAADLEFRAGGTIDPRELALTVRAVQAELEQVDRDVAERYFSGAGAAAEHYHAVLS